MKVAIMVMCLSSKKIQYYSTVEFDRNTVGNVAGKINFHSTKYAGIRHTNCFMTLQSAS